MTAVRYIAPSLESADAVLDAPAFNRQHLQQPDIASTASLGPARLAMPCR